MQMGEATKAKHVAAIDAVEKEFAKAKQVLKTSASAFAVAQSGKDASDISLLEARQAVRTLGTELRKRTRELDSVRAKLAKHQTGPLAAFNELRERVVPQVEENVVEAVELEAEAEPARLPRTCLFRARQKRPRHRRLGPRVPH